MNTDGNGKTKLWPGDAPAWSRDGTKIAYDAQVAVPGGGTTRCVFVRNADGSGAPTQATFPETLTDDRMPESSYTTDQWADWSPDGRYLAFVRGGNATSWKPWVCVVEAGRPVTVLYDALTELPFAEVHRVSWSRNSRGGYIAFSRTYQPAGGEYTWLLRVLPVSGPTVTGPAIDLLGAASPAWNSDGTELAFKRWGGGISRIAFNPQGLDMANAVTVTTGSSDVSATWSPDDAAIAFRSVGAKFNFYELYRVAASGGTPVNLTNTSRTSEFAPNWSPVLP